MKIKILSSVIFGLLMQFSGIAQALQMNDTCYLFHTDRPSSDPVVCLSGVHHGGPVTASLFTRDSELQCLRGFGYKESLDQFSFSENGTVIFTLRSLRGSTHPFSGQFSGSSSKDYSVIEMKPEMAQNYREASHRAHCF